MKFLLIVYGQKQFHEMFLWLGLCLDFGFDFLGYIEFHTLRANIGTFPKFEDYNINNILFIISIILNDLFYHIDPFYVTDWIFFPIKCWHFYNGSMRVSMARDFLTLLITVTQVSQNTSPLIHWVITDLFFQGISSWKLSIVILK